MDEKNETIIADVFIGHAHNVGELMDILQLFDRDMPIVLENVDKDADSNVNVVREHEYYYNKDYNIREDNVLKLKLE